MPSRRRFLAVLAAAVAARHTPLPAPAPAVTVHRLGGLAGTVPQWHPVGGACSALDAALRDIYAPAMARIGRERSPLLD